MKVLVTGGAGYIGSHTCIELLYQGYEVVVLDNLVNSSEESLYRVQQITGKKLEFYKADLMDRQSMLPIFQNHKFDAVIHFAGYKAVGESVEFPMLYYNNNVVGSIRLFELMSEFKVKNLVFSSSCTVYGEPHAVPMTEDFPLQTASPYGRSKLMVEQIATDMQAADPEWNVILLRYFNPVGAEPGGRIGEDPTGIPNNLMPYITGVAVGKFPKLRVWGSDYPTHDGTGVRDYIHVVDLAKGHLKALDRFSDNAGCEVFNLGTGVGYSVLDIVKAFIKTTGIDIPYELHDRRPGDVTEVYADPAKALKVLGWKAELGLEDMCRDGWKWQSENPKGYHA
jgi:UDP-glucose 4-epimerase